MKKHDEPEHHHEHIQKAPSKELRINMDDMTITVYQDGKAANTTPLTGDTLRALFPDLLH